MIRTLLAATAASIAFSSVVLAQSTDSAARSETVTLTGTIEAIDAEKREVVIAGESGKSVVIEAGDEVQNFDQIEVGDKVVLEYIESVMVGMAVPGDDGSPEAAIVAARSALGEKPGAAEAELLTFVVEVKSYDADTKMATVIFPEGEERTLPVHEKMLDFAASRQTGDKVLVAIGRAVAIEVKSAE